MNQILAPSNRCGKKPVGPKQMTVPSLQGFTKLSGIESHAMLTLMSLPVCLHSFGASLIRGQSVNIAWYLWTLSVPAYSYSLLICCESLSESYVLSPCHRYRFLEDCRINFSISLLLSNSPYLYILS